MKQRGILLLPVALTLAIVAALAYTMTSEGSMNVSAVDAQYDVEVARYVAASGVQIAKWRAATYHCDANRAKLGTLNVPDGRVTVNSASMSGGFLTVGVSASTSRNAGTAQGISTRVPVFDFEVPAKQATVIGGGDDDTTIMLAGGTKLADETTLTASDDAAYPLLFFKLPGELEDKGSLIRADLKVTKQSGNATQPDRSLAVHRVTRSWKGKEATWVLAAASEPWATPGGDYAAEPAASVAIDPGNGATNSAYPLRIDALVQSWADGTFPNYGILLKPTRLVNALFVSNNGASKPELTVRYFKRCK
jgi:hypothetical protein